MRVTRIGLLGLVFATGLFVGAVFTNVGWARTAPDTSCGNAARPQVRTTLYFGLARPRGSVSELEWQTFLRDEVTARFPSGLTVWDADGQWRGQDGGVGHERSKVLLLVHPDTSEARSSLQNLIGRYRKLFEQESVLWESARVCAAS
jgi:hypothetical protein